MREDSPSMFGKLTGLLFAAAAAVSFHHIIITKEIRRSTCLLSNITVNNPKLQQGQQTFPEFFYRMKVKVNLFENPEKVDIIQEKRLLALIMSKHRRV